MDKLGLGLIELDKKTAQPYDQQFWEQFDIIMQLSEEEMRQELPNFIADSSNKAKFDALLSGRANASIGHETTKKFSVQ